MDEIPPLGQLVTMSYASIPIIPLGDLSSSLQQNIIKHVLSSPVPLIVFLHLKENYWFRVGILSSDRNSERDDASCQNDIETSNSHCNGQPIPLPMNGIELQFSTDHTDVLLKDVTISQWECVICHIHCSPELVASHIRGHLEKYFCFFCCEIKSGTQPHACCKEEFPMQFNCICCKFTSQNATDLYDHLCTKHYPIKAISNEIIDVAEVLDPLNVTNCVSTRVAVHKETKQILECEFCGKSVENSYKLKKHIRVVHPLVSHNCHLCSSTFKTATNLRVHIKEIHEADTNQFTCDICLKTFRQKRNFVRHKNTVHQEKLVREPFSIVYYESPTVPP